MKGRRRQYPINTLALPFRCGNPTCSCGDGPGEPYEATPKRTPSGWLVEVTDGAGMAVDVFRGRDLNGVLLDVHREYPGAEFDPEPGE